MIFALTHAELQMNFIQTSTSMKSQLLNDSEGCHKIELTLVIWLSGRIDFLPSFQLR